MGESESGIKRNREDKKRKKKTQGQRITGGWGVVRAKGYGAFRCVIGAVRLWLK